MLYIYTNSPCNNIIMIEKNIETPDVIKTQHEKKRVEAVRSYHLLDTLPERDFDNITFLAANICNAPTAHINLIDSDRNFIKSYYGSRYSQKNREGSFYEYTIQEEKGLFIVEDARKDVRFKDHTLVTTKNIVFYAGVPLVNPKGYVLGTLCVFDTIPRKLTNRQKQSLISLAYQVVRLFKVRKYNRNLLALQEELQERNEELKNFAGVVSHDMKMPLANMVLTSDMLRSKYNSKLDDQGKEYLDYIKQSALTLSTYITGLLAHYESGQTASSKEEGFDSHDLFEKVIELLSIREDIEINLPEKNIDLQANYVALEQILINLITNSLKYNDKTQARIDLGCRESENYYHFKIEDNGQGIQEEELDRIFDLFATTNNVDRQGQRGSGIGLSTVKKIVNKLGGDIHVASTLGKGTTFEFTIQKI